MLRKSEYLNPIDLRPFCALEDYNAAERELMKFVNPRGVLPEYLEVINGTRPRLSEAQRLAGPIQNDTMMKSVYFKIMEKKGLVWRRVETIPMLATHVKLMEKFNAEKFTSVIADDGHIWTFESDNSGYMWKKSHQADISHMHLMPVIVNSNVYTLNCRTRV